MGSGSYFDSVQRIERAVVALRSVRMTDNKRPTIPRESTREARDVDYYDTREAGINDPFLQYRGYGTESSKDIGRDVVESRGSTSSISRLFGAHAGDRMVSETIKKLA